MRLSAQIYLQILASLKSDALKDRSKRREPRVGLAGEAEFVTVNEWQIAEIKKAVAEHGNELTEEDREWLDDKTVGSELL